MQNLSEIKQFREKVNQIKNTFAKEDARFLQDDAYWQAHGLQARYRYCMMKNAMRLLFALSYEKSPGLAEQLTKKVKRVMSLEGEYNFRRKNVMLCNLHLMNVYKLEKQHGINTNKIAYERLTSTIIEYPVFDLADQIINNFIALKKVLLSFDSQDLFLLQWPQKQISDVEIALMLKVMKTIFDDITIRVIHLCQDPTNIPNSSLHYLDYILREKSSSLQNLSALHNKLQEIEPMWVSFLK